MNRLHYKEPARQWEEALPIGNGRLGAMIYGYVATEQIQLNEISVWSGEPKPDADRPNAYKHLPKLRKLIDEKQYNEACKLLNSEFTNYGGGFDAAYFSSYQTLGDLYIQQFSENTECSNYYRYLDIDQAIAGVSFCVDGVKYEREFLSSAPAGIMAYRFTASKKGQINLVISIERLFSTVSTVGDTLVMRGQTENAPGDTSKGIIFESHLKAINKNGKVYGDGKKIIVENADEVILLFAARTDYILDQSKGYRGEDPHEKVATDVHEAAKKCYCCLKSAHFNDYKKFYDANTIKFQGEDFSEMLTPDRLVRYNEGNEDVGLIELFYQYGRYLLICSSRPDNELPANLQGIWCKDYEGAWHCDFHLNINVQMNYWLAGPTNLTECTRPLANLIKGLVENGRKTVQSYFNTEGWTVYTITNPFGWTSPGWTGGWAQYPLGGAWMTQHLCEYYAFSKDRSLLEELWDVIRENCLFNISMLVEDEDGSLITNPSTSPENNFRDEEGRVSWVCKGNAMDIEMLYENFTYAINICNILDKDLELRDKMISLRDKLRKLRIGKEGQLCEWYGDWDLDAPEIHHRHCSHLYGVHPGTMISPLTTPDLADAAKKSLEIRGDDGTGWSLAWKINFWARLKDGNRAYKLLRKQLKIVSDLGYNYSNGGGVYLNLFDAHPPFQIDGNFGATAGISEMFVQNHMMTSDGAYIIDLLPSVPDVLSTGEIKGMLSRGNFEINIKWQDKKATKVEVKSKMGEKCAIYGEVKVLKDDLSVNTYFLDGSTVFDTEKDAVYTIIL